MENLMTEEELIFIKKLENKLNVSEYSEIRRIINKYANTADYNKVQYERQKERTESRDKKIQELYETEKRRSRTVQ